MFVFLTSVSASQGDSIHRQAPSSPTSIQHAELAVKKPTRAENGRLVPAVWDTPPKLRRQTLTNGTTLTDDRRLGVSEPSNKF